MNPRRLRPTGTTVLLLVWLTLPGCSSLKGLLEDAASADLDVRQEAVEDLEAWVRDLPAGEPGTADGRRRIEEFLATRLQPGNEREAVIRAQLVSLALQGEFSNTPRLLLLAADDPEWLVRQAAIQGLAECPVDSARDLLTRTVEKDPNLWVRITAAKVFRYVGESDWAAPLVRIVIDEAENPSLRFQAYLSAKALTGSELPYVPRMWEEQAQLIEAGRNEEP